jgi:hypothetical protein
MRPSIDGCGGQGHIDKGSGYEYRALSSTLARAIDEQTSRFQLAPRLDGDFYVRRPTQLSWELELWGMGMKLYMDMGTGFESRNREKLLEGKFRFLVFRREKPNCLIAFLLIHTLTFCISYPP